PDRGAVKAQALLEDVLLQLGDGDREVLPETGHVDEAQIDDPGPFLLGQLQDVFRGHRSTSLVRWVRMTKPGGRQTFPAPPAANSLRAVRPPPPGPPASLGRGPGSGRGPLRGPGDPPRVTRRVLAVARAAEHIGRLRVL